VDRQQVARERYQAVVGTSGERLVSGSDDFTLFMWHPAEGRTPVARMTGHQQLVNHILFSPDSRYIASASFDKKVKLWCGKTGRFLTTFNGHVNPVYQVSWSADSNFVVSASKDSTVKVWSVKSPKTALFTLPGHADEVYALDWSPDGTQVASGSKDRTIKIWHH
jgi:ribosome assembly protein 4